MATVGGLATPGGPTEVDSNRLDIIELARFAVDDYNKKQNSLLVFKKVKNAKEQVVTGMKYYITLEADDGGATKVYEAKVWVKEWENFKQVEEFKQVDNA